MDFGLLPPEINSARMYAGPGSGPMLAAVAAWDEVAAELHSTAASYSSVISGLTLGWRGPSSLAMAAAVGPYMAWMSTTAAQAEQTANQARAAVAAYETAFAATVPPPVIAANRAQLMALIATNFFGQNTPAIMATQAEYIEMWAQDAAAMYGYAGSSASASQVTPFGQPPQTTNPAGSGSQAAAVGQAASTASGAQGMTLPQLMSATPQALQSLAAPTTAAAPAASSPSPTTVATVLNNFVFGTYSPLSNYAPIGSNYLLGVQSFLTPFNGQNVQMAYNSALSKASSSAASAGLGSRPSLVGSPGMGGVSAGMGRGGLVGGLSVPQGWATSAPEIKTIAAILPQSDAAAAAPAAMAAEGQGGLYSNMALSGLAGRAMAGTGGSAARSAGMGSVGTGTPATTANIFVIPEAAE